MKPCIRCGEPSPATRCDDCAPTAQYVPKTSAKDRGYDNNWAKLSRRARRLQPWCTDCRATTDLQLDHTPETWKRKAEGKVIRLQDTGGVVCQKCNIRRGASRGNNPRGEDPESTTLNSAGQAQRPSHTTSRSTTEGSMR